MISVSQCVTKTMAFCDEFFAPLHVVEEFSVKDHEDTLVFVRHRLLALGQIDNAQPSRGERNSRSFEKTFLVRPTVSESTRHSLHHPVRRPALSHQIDYSCNATHDFVE